MTKGFNVYLMVPYMSWLNVRVQDDQCEQDAIDICVGEVDNWPDAEDGPIDFLAVEVETVPEGDECPYCGEDRADRLIPTGPEDTECLSCKSVYQVEPLIMTISVRSGGETTEIVAEL